MLTAEENHRIDVLVACGLHPEMTATVCAYLLPDGKLTVRIEEEHRFLHGWLLEEAMRSHGHRSTLSCPVCAQQHRPRHPRLAAAAKKVQLVVGGFLFGWALSEAFSQLPWGAL